MRRIGMLALLLALAAATAVAADRSARKLDTLWQVGDLASLDIRGISFMPVATFDGNVEARRLTEDAVGKAFRGSGHRWLSTAVTREMIRSAGGDSLANALQKQVLALGRVDSLDAPYFSRLTRSRAILTVRVDKFEKLEMEFNQNGKPTTSVGLTAALVDSTGRLLWSARGGENAEGPYHDGNAGAIGVNASGLNNKPITGQAGAPGYPETLGKLLARWTPVFPRRGAADSTVTR